MPADRTSRIAGVNRSQTASGSTLKWVGSINYIVSGQNYDMLTSIIAQLLTSRPFPDLRRLNTIIYMVHGVVRKLND